MIVIIIVSFFVSNGFGKFINGNIVIDEYDFSDGIGSDGEIYKIFKLLKKRYKKSFC